MQMSAGGDIAPHRKMSAMTQSDFTIALTMSAFGGKADIASAPQNVR
jgi:hypothetical protein